MTRWRLLGFDDEELWVRASSPLITEALTRGVTAERSYELGRMELAVESDDPAVLEAIESAAERNGVRLERVD